MRKQCQDRNSSPTLTPLPHPYSRYCIDLENLIVYHAKKQTPVSPFYKRGSKRTYYNLYLDYKNPSGKVVRTSVQRAELVLRVTQGAPKLAKYEVSHLDNDCTNDRPDNLIWETKGSNVNRYVLQTDRTGMKNPNAKVMPNLAHKLYSEGLSAKKIAKYFGVHPSTIYRILKNPPSPVTDDDTDSSSTNPFL